MENLNLGDLVGKPYGTHKHFNVSLIDLLTSCKACVLVINFFSYHYLLCNVFDNDCMSYVLY